MTRQEVAAVHAREVQTGCVCGVPMRGGPTDRAKSGGCPSYLNSGQSRTPEIAR